MLVFSDDIEVYVVPRLEDELIDDLFYQEDEIGEMRHTAFMIECGLEEDPPDGPDVPPVPWGNMLLLKQHQEKSAASVGSGVSKTSPMSVLDAPEETEPLKSDAPRALPERTRSADDVEELMEGLPPKKNRVPPERRKLVATKSGSLHAVRQPKSPTRSPPGKSHSSDELMSGGTSLSLPFARTDKEASPRKTRRLVATKSGSLHGMQVLAKKAAEAGDESAAENSPQRLRRMTRCKSGTTHGMRKMAEAANAKNLAKAEDDATKVVSVNGQQAVEESPRRPRRMTRCKSGTTHGMRMAAEAAIARKAASREDSPTSSTDEPSANKSKDVESSSKEETHIVFRNGKRTVVSKAKKQEDQVLSSNSGGLDLPPRPVARGGSNSSVRSVGSLRGNGSQCKASSPRSTFNASSSSSDDDFLSDLESCAGDDNSIDVSISTDGDDDLLSDEPDFSSSPSKGSGTKSTPEKKIKDKKKMTTKIATKERDESSTSEPLKSTIRKPWLSPKAKGSTETNASSDRRSAVNSALDNLRNGTYSPSELLASAQRRDVTSTKAATSKSKNGTTNGTGAKKFRTKTVGSLNIPSTFQNADVPPAFRTKR